jgi:phosphoglycerate dehydrogenase-like enzyme
VASADVLVPTTAVCGADVVNAAHNLKLIVQPAAGYNNIAVEAAQARGIPVCTSPGVPGLLHLAACLLLALPHVATSTGGVPRCAERRKGRFAADWQLRPAGPGVNAASVAEAAVMMLLMLARRVPEQLVTFAKRGLGEPLGMQLSGKTLGIIGMGAIGAAPPALPRPPQAPPAVGTAQAHEAAAAGLRVARAAEALGMHVRGHKSASTPAELSALLAAADAVSLVRARLPCTLVSPSSGTICGPGRPLPAACFTRVLHTL